MLSITGIILTIAGIVITAIATTQYQNSSTKKQTEIEELNKQILSLSDRISKQSEFIQKQITGGNAFGYAKLLKYTNEYGDIEYTLEIYNDFQYPIKNLQILWLDVESINNECFVTKGNKQFLNENCVSKHRKIINVGDIPAKSQNTILPIRIKEQDISSKYVIQYNTRNGKYFQKILINKHEGVVYSLAYQILKDNKILKEFTDGDFPEKEKDFKNGFQFIDEKFSYLR